MAEMMIVKFKLKKELTEEQLAPVKAEFELKLKSIIRKEKTKGKLLTWFLKANKPALISESSIALAFKRAKLPKAFVTVDIEKA